jgi:hypothetical protein
MAKKPLNPKPDKAATDETDVYVQSAVNLLKSDWKLLRRVADARADVKGGRRSVSGVIASLIADRRKQLQAEAKD